MRQYSSFLVRRWRLSGDRERVEIEHSQTGRRALLSSLNETISWIEEVDFVTDENELSIQPPAADVPLRETGAEPRHDQSESGAAASLTTHDPEIGPIAATLNAGEENCAQLIMNVRQAIDRLDPGEVLEVQAYDPSAQVDLRCWCGMTGHGYLGMKDQDDYTMYYLRRRGDSDGQDSDIR